MSYFIGKLQLAEKENIMFDVWANRFALSISGISAVIAVFFAFRPQFERLRFRDCEPWPLEYEDTTIAALAGLFSLIGLILSMLSRMPKR